MQNNKQILISLIGFHCCHKFSLAMTNLFIHVLQLNSNGIWMFLELFQILFFMLTAWSAWRALKCWKINWKRISTTYIDVVFVDYIVVNISRFYMQFIGVTLFLQDKKAYDGWSARASLLCKIHFIPMSRLGTWASRNVKHYSTLHFTRWRALGELFWRLLLVGSEAARLDGSERTLQHAWNCTRWYCRTSELSAWIIACLMTGVLGGEGDKTRFPTFSRRANNLSCFRTNNLSRVAFYNIIVNAARWILNQANDLLNKTSGTFACIIKRYYTLLTFQ